MFRDTMGNCCGSEALKSKEGSKESGENDAPGAVPKVILVAKLSSRGEHGITDKYNIGKELGRGEFGITYLCTEKDTQDVLACKSISKRKLRTPVDVEEASPLSLECSPSSLKAWPASKSFSLKPSVARSSCSLHDDVKDFAHKCAEAGKLAAVTLATTTALIASI